MMQKRKLGKTGLEVTVLGFGGAEVGFSDASPERVTELLNSALDAGLNVIDTAECYRTSEENIGKAVSHRRKDYYLFTKVGHSESYENHDYNDMKRLEASLDRSLKRLKTDHIDLLQVHSCDQATLEKGVTMEFMKKAKQSGKTRFIGYSGDNEEALYAVRLGVFDALQTSVSIGDQREIDVLLPEAVKREMGIIIKRPVANAAWQYTETPNEYFIPYWERFKKLQYPFLSKPLGEAVAIAMRFTLGVPGFSTMIVGTQKPGRWQENAKIVAQGPLPKAEFDAIRKRWKEVAPPDWKGEI